jgi:hypothetical protein
MIKYSVMDQITEGWQTGFKFKGEIKKEDDEY